MILRGGNRLVMKFIVEFGEFGELFEKSIFL